jgi:peptide deformylase
MEGCLSVPGSHWPLGRAAELEYRAQSVDGTPRTGSATGLLAHIFQHEVDHLDGKVLLHKLDAAQKKEALAALSRPARA